MNASYSKTDLGTENGLGGPPDYSNRQNLNYMLPMPQQIILRTLLQSAKQIGDRLLYVRRNAMKPIMSKIQKRK